MFKTAIEQKVMLVRRYIHEFKGVDIIDIKLTDGMDLAKLDYAVQFAQQYFNE